MAKLVLFATCLLTSGCYHTVVVHDASNRPVQGARVTGTTLSMSEVEYTNANGAAHIHLNVQACEWVEVKKDGFEPVQTYAPRNWPLRITLIPTNHP
jgi:hypothetical protein